ncbi:DUF2605 domain-containing protein [Tumidithrix elongata RA019]|uniref:DUF2605 domain-containing protein n=1 Tax=Tumidithrix elongata BACA0141 TaxID=2716417 RepID=A0AAW9PU62_9CYAN|nr:DUF2605 domain-containing protein [Tumidithrix elongata RA019]
MNSSPIPESDLLKQILEPLLEDFRYWFERSQDLLEREKLEFMSEVEQSTLLQKVRNAQQEVNSATSLFNLTGQQVGIDVQAMMPWHSLLMECQAVGMRYRQTKQT